MIERGRLLPLQFRGHLLGQGLLPGEGLVHRRLARRVGGEARRGEQLQMILEPLGGQGVQFVDVGHRLAEAIVSAVAVVRRSAASPCWNKAMPADVFGSTAAAGDAWPGDGDIGCPWARPPVRDKGSAGGGAGACLHV